MARAVDADGDGALGFEDTYFVYDGTPGAVSLDRAAVTTDQIGQIVLQFDDDAQGAPQLTHRYLWGPAVDQILADEEVTSLVTPGDVLWPLTDHLGTVRDLAQRDPTTGETAIASHRTFDSYGNLLTETNPALDHLFAFTGRALDTSTALQNNLNRWYDARVGRWISQDPVAFTAGDANLCRYVVNSPLSLTDPSGLIPASSLSLAQLQRILDMLEFSSAAYPGEELSNRLTNAGWKPVKRWPETKSGLVARLFRNTRTGRYVLAFGGTKSLHHFGDWRSNKQGATDAYDQQYEDALKVMEEFFAKYRANKRNLEVAGHSLGGKLAVAIAIEYDLYAVAFNSGPLGRKFMAARDGLRWQLDHPMHQEQIWQVYIPGEVLTAFIDDYNRRVGAEELRRPGSPIELNAPAGSNPFDCHMVGRLREAIEQAINPP